MDIKTILEYYAIFCLAFSPVNVGMLIVLYKKTNVIQKIDGWIDRILDSEKKEKTKENGPAESKTAEEEKKTEQESVPLDAGVSAFSLKVGEKYFCMPTAQSRQYSFQEVVWSLDNHFLGEITPEGEFNSAKPGTVNIYYNYKGDVFENAALAYQIRILPSNQNWKYDRLLSNISARRKKPDLLSDLLQREPLRENDILRTVSFKGDGEDERVSIQFDARENAERAAVLFRPEKKDIIEETVREMDERLEPVPVNGTQTRIWIRRNEDETRNEIEIYACLHTLPDGRTALLIGQNWREYGQTDEFIRNLSMALRMFSELLPGENFPELKANIKVNKESTPQKEERRTQTQPLDVPAVPSEALPSEHPEAADDRDDPATGTVPEKEDENHSETAPGQAGAQTENPVQEEEENAGQEEDPGASSPDPGPDSYYNENSDLEDDGGQDEDDGEEDGFYLDFKEGEMDPENQ